jgi:hypothetical protein
MPVASAERHARTMGANVFTRPMGRPRKIVAPAIAPSRRMCPVVMTCSSLSV